MAANAKAKEAKKAEEAKANPLPPLNKSQKLVPKKPAAVSNDMGSIREVDENRGSVAGKGAEDLKDLMKSKKEADPGPVFAMKKPPPKATVDPATRRQSHMDTLAAQIASRWKDINQNPVEESDENNEDSDSESDGSD